MNNYSQLVDYPYGQIVARVIAGAAAGSETLSMQTSATGIEEIVLAAWAYHDDTGNSRALQWQFYDSIVSATAIWESMSVLDFVKVSCYKLSITATRDENAFQLPLKIDRQRYLQVVVPALTAAKKAYIHAVVLRRFGQAN